MQAYQLVALTRSEREIFQRVIPSFGVTFDEAIRAGRDHEDHHLVRALNNLAKDGSQVTHEAASRAVEALARQVAQCAIEADVEHWRRTLLRPVPAGARRAGVALVQDPEQMCEVLAEARKVQLRQAQAAMTLAMKALTLTTPVPSIRGDFNDDEIEAGT